MRSKLSLGSCIQSAPRGNVAFLTFRHGGSSKEDEFAAQVDQKDFFFAYVLSRDPTPDKPACQGDIFIFPVRDFDRIIRCGIQSKGRKVYLSRMKGEAERWFLRIKARRFEKITDETCLEVTAYRRNFGALLEGV